METMETMAITVTILPTRVILTIVVLDNLPLPPPPLLLIHIAVQENTEEVFQLLEVEEAV